MSKKISLALVDDHQIVIDGLLSLLGDVEQFEIAFATTNPLQVLPLLTTTKVDVLLTDVMMPRLKGSELAVQVKNKFPEVRILALSMDSDGSTVSEMVEEADISGYVLKNIGKTELITAIAKIAAGGIYFSEPVLEEMKRMQYARKQQVSIHLSEREIEIVRLIEKEFNNKQIAEKLFISERTVETHRKNIFRKTNTSGVIGLIKYAYEHKLI